MCVQMRHCSRRSLEYNFHYLVYKFTNRRNIVYIVECCFYKLATIRPLLWKLQLDRRSQRLSVTVSLYTTSIVGDLVMCSCHRTLSVRS